MNNDLNPSKKEEEPEESPRHLTINGLAAYSIPAETFNNLYKSINLPMISELLEIINSQNRLFESNLSKILSSPAFELSTTVNQSIGRLIAIQTPYVDQMLKVSAFQEQFFQSQIWKDQQNSLSKMLESLPLNDLVWRSHLIDISKFAMLSETALAQIPFEKIGNELDVSNTTRNNLRNVFLNFSKSYSKLYGSLEKQPSIITGLPPVISKFPAVEFFNGVMVLDSITIGEGEDHEFEIERQQAADETIRETTDRLNFLLAQLNVDFITPLEGARLALVSGNPDRTRHFSASLRELFTHVLHTLAPDEKVEKWSKNPKNYDKGKLTRAARLNFICRELNNGSFSPFIKKDITALLAFLDLFQEGTHEMASKYTDLQLKVMLVRMESTLRYILEISSLY